VSDIDTLRKRIDALDVELVRLLSERAACALEIGRLKERLGMPIYQPAREADVLTNVRGANTGPLADEALTRLFERIIDEARRLERLAAQARETKA
jgi:chorismate mutase-like protein